MLTDDVVIESYMQQITALAEHGSMRWDNEVNPNFVLGYVMSDFKFALKSLELTQEQLTTLMTRL